MSTNPKIEAIEQQCYQAAAVVKLVRDRLMEISGDEEELVIAEASADWSSALDAAKRVMENVAEEVRQLEKEPQP